MNIDKWQALDGWQKVAEKTDLLSAQLHQKCMLICDIFAGAILDPTQLICDECDKEFLESYLYDKFSCSVCDNCRLASFWNILTN